MFENTLRYNHNGETKAVKKAAQYHDSLLIPAHFVAVSPRKIAGLLERLQTDFGTEFYVDPRLPAYRVGREFWDKPGKLGQWDQALAEYYGKPVTDILIKKGNLTVGDLSQEQLREVIESQCEFQLSMVADAAQAKLGRYMDLEADLRPRAIVPWYVKITSIRDLEINEWIIETAQEYSNYPVKPCFFTTPDFLSDETRLSALIELISGCDIREVFVWVEGLTKRKTDPMDYAHTAKLIYEISDSNIRPHLLYGSYFDHLLGYLGNRGSGFGPAYQESKAEKTGDEGKSGGGGTNRYYFNPVKTFLNFQETEHLGDENNEPLCECEICSRELGSWSEIYKFDGDYTAQSRHYIEVRQHHSSELSTLALGEKLTELEDKYSLYKDSLGNSDTAAQPYHLRKWKTGIEHFVEEMLEEDISQFQPVPEEEIEM
ncbi:hypothetical protein [Haloplanus aerogenes]|uniref:tRNA-guanine family transglycosylase n=1 Tax=Haloplanus aerogenes TaxID=660522 RepID=A0A3M0CL13_9EURY|nr:hypothetical protein [Haloplanus aerogenes]AZH26849.1 hypothetical protein DU502_16355 [Haloplanus aerogenes]RMB09060.1 hypothetical protein ATH50_3430 [Haloplanus aerogenes]